MNKFINAQESKTLNFQSSSFELVSNDTINELALLETIKKTRKVEELGCIALQLSIAGYGNKTLNKYKYKGSEKEIKDLFKELKFKSDNPQNSTLNETDLTPRRLQRIFRYQVKSFLEANPSVSSYLFNKYSDRNLNYRTICFPGAEHLVEKDDEARYLMQCYKNLDESLKQSNRQYGFSERLTRVFLARGLKYE